MASRPICTTGIVNKIPTEPTTPNKDAGASTTGGTTGRDGGGGGGGKKNTLTCPKCGDPCTHVETFVCKFFLKNKK